MTNRYSASLIDFQGFYESIHSEEIDYTCEQMFQDDNGESLTSEEFYEKFHYTQKMLDSYCKAYVKKLKQYLEEECDLDLPSMEFEELKSPKFYNFETDKIYITVDEADVKKIQARCQENQEDLVKVIGELFTPRSGFIPFYSNDPDEWNAMIQEAPGEMDHNELGTLLKAAANGGWDDNEVIHNGDNFHEITDRIVEAHMPAECRKMLHDFNSKQHTTGMSLG